MGLIEHLGRGPVAIDTVAFIYFIEEHPRYLPLVDELFRAVDAGRLPAVTSELTLLEVLVFPRSAGCRSCAGTVCCDPEPVSDQSSSSRRRLHLTTRLRSRTGSPGSRSSRSRFSE